MYQSNRLIHRIPSQHDFADYFGDFYDNRSFATDRRVVEMSSSIEQISVGRAGVQSSYSFCSLLIIPLIVLFI
jgi:hypothetical protein